MRLSRKIFFALARASVACYGARMRTKKRNASAVKTDSPNMSDTSSVASPVIDVVEIEKEKPNRISFNTTPEGAPDWERMLPKTKSQLTEILRSKAVQKELGISPEEAREAIEAGFGEDEANALLDLLSGINSVAASKIYGVPGEITSVAFKFSEDHRKKINPPLSRVLNKWGPAILKTWKDEIGLGLVLLATLNAQIRLMHMLEDRRKKNLPAQPPAKVSSISEVKPAETSLGD